MGSEINDWLVLKWFATVEVGSNLATTATSIANDKLANQLSKWWDMESYASNCDVTGHSKEEQRAIKTLEQTTQFNGERYEVGLLWREDEVKLPNNFSTSNLQWGNSSP